MSTTALQSQAGKVVRVAVVATTSARRAELLRTLDSVGLVSVESMRDADVILCDGEPPAGPPVIPAIAPIVTLGAAQIDQDGALAADATADQIDAAIRAVAAGLVVRTARDHTKGFEAMRRSNVRSLLTPREVEMLSAIAAGLSNKAIARHLDISLHTVKFHIESLFRKLGARSRAEAVAKGLERSRSETVEL